LVYKNVIVRTENRKIINFKLALFYLKYQFHIICIINVIHYNICVLCDIVNRNPSDEILLAGHHP